MENVKTAQRLRDGARSGARTAGTGMAAAETFLRRRDAACRWTVFGRIGRRTWRCHSSGRAEQFESKLIRLADLKGNIQAYPESDETFPRVKSQQRAVVQQLMSSTDPTIQQALADPANIGYVKGLLGLSDMVVPGEDSRNKQLREIDLLLAGAPVAVRTNRSAGVSPAGVAEDGEENRRQDAGVNGFTTAKNFSDWILRFRVMVRQAKNRKEVLHSVST